MKAVIWTDVFQAGCMMFGMIAIIISVSTVGCFYAKTLGLYRISKRLVL